MKFAMCLGVSLALTGCAAGRSAGTDVRSPQLAPAPVAPRLPDGLTAAEVALGDSLFNNGSCVRCHGPRGTAGPRGPDLTDSAWAHVPEGNFAGLVALITRGVPAAEQKLPTSQAQFAMRARGGMGYTDAQVRAVAGYVWTLSRPRLAP